MQQIDLPSGNAEHQPCIIHIDHHDPFTRAQRSTGANFQTVNASAFRGKSQPFYQPGSSEDQGNNGDECAAHLQQWRSRNRRGRLHSSVVIHH